MASALGVLLTPPGALTFPGDDTPVVYGRQQTNYSCHVPHLGNPMTVGALDYLVHAATPFIHPRPGSSLAHTTSPPTRYPRQLWIGATPAL